MPDSSPKEPQNDATQKSVDLSDLQSFSFGTQWTEASKSASSTGGNRPGDRGGPRGGDRPDRRRGAPSGPPRKDRRPPRTPRPGEATGERAPVAEGERRFDGNRRQGRGHGFGAQAKPAFRPYESPVFDICFYPEDNCFSAIIKAMRANHMTYELFHVAKLFMEKPDRFLASVTRKAEAGQKPEKVFICAPDNMPFATEEEAILHAANHHIDKFFNTEEIEVEAPSGNFPFVNRCPFTKELLGPPNYHKYQETLRNHHRTRLPNMAFEKLQSSIETVREEEVVAQWLDSQKTATRYTAKEILEGEEAPRVFNSLEDALGFLRTTLRGKIVKQVNYARVSGTILESFPGTEAFKAMDGERQRQLRFPLDTANAIRGRMRREKFSIYKKGAKGVTYVCATKRNFRAPGQVMSPELDRLIAFLEANQLVKAKELHERYSEWLKTEKPDVVFDDKRLARDLHWLIADGYVSHFEDDTLFAQPVLDTGSEKEHAPAKKAHKPAEKPSVAEGEKAPEAAESAPQAEAAPEAPVADVSEAADAQAAAEESDPAAEAKEEAPAESAPSGPAAAESEAVLEPEAAPESVQSAPQAETATETPVAAAPEAPAAPAAVEESAPATEAKEEAPAETAPSESTAAESEEVLESEATSEGDVASEPETALEPEPEAEPAPESEPTPASAEVESPVEEGELEEAKKASGDSDDASKD